MLQISPIAFTSNEVNNRRLSDEKREDIRDTAVAGGAAGAGYTAVKGGGLNMAKKLKALKIKEAVFDRGGYLYHGRVAALAEAIRQGGIKF